MSPNRENELSHSPLLWNIPGISPRNHLIPYLYYTQSQSNIQRINCKFSMNLYYTSSRGCGALRQMTCIALWRYIYRILHCCVRLVDSARLSSLWRTGLILRFGIRRMTDILLTAYQP